MAMTLQELLLAMGEGNPGAITVMARLLEREDGLFVLLHLDEMGIYGPDIWVAYKDHCDEDLEQLARRVKARDPRLKEARTWAR